jgi:hypothetical protein
MKCGMAVVSKFPRSAEATCSVLRSHYERFEEDDGVLRDTAPATPRVEGREVSFDQHDRRAAAIVVHRTRCAIGFLDIGEPTAWQRSYGLAFRRRVVGSRRRDN